MLEQALVSGITAAKDYKMVWEAYIDYLRRRVPWEESGEIKEKRLKELRDCSARGIEHLDQCKFISIFFYIKCNSLPEHSQLKV
jgi:hypothetical protein